MADYHSILDKAVSGLADNTPANRAIIYDKARAAIERKLRAMDPVPSEDAIARQLGQLETAIAQVEDSQVAETAPEADIQPEVMPTEPIQPDPAGHAAELPAEPADDEQAHHEPQEAVGDAGTATEPEGFVDDVILIDGIGEKTREMMAAEGITSLTQIAAMSDDQLAVLAEKIGHPGFEQTQEWKPQAQAMIAGALPRSKTDQARLEKMREEAGGAVAGAGMPVDTETGAAGDQPAAPIESGPTEPKVSEAIESGPELFFETPTVADVPPPAQPQMDPPVEPPLSEPVSMEQNPIKPVVPPVEEQSMQASQPPAGDKPSPATVSSEPVVQNVDSGMAAQMGQPAVPGLPEAAPPPFVSELENDPVSAPASDPYLERSVRVQPPKRGGFGKILASTSIVAIIAAAAAGGYYYRDQVVEYANKGVGAVQALIDGARPKDDSNESPQAETVTSEAAISESTAESDEGDDSGSKDTTRLNSDGSETVEPVEPESEPVSEPSQEQAETVETGQVTVPAVEESEEPATVEVEEDTGTAASSEESTSDESGTGANAGQDSAGSDTQSASEAPVVISGEKAFLYEEVPGSSGASRDEGGMVWSLAEEAPEAGAEPEAVIKGVMEIPTRGLTLNLTIKRNVDAGLPATHIIELDFDALPEFSGGNIDGVARFVMKSTEQARGESLVGIPVRIDTGLFWIALNNLEQAQQTNMGLLQNGNWADIVVNYVTGRRAALTFAKGTTGDEVFTRAFEDWKNR